MRGITISSLAFILALSSTVAVAAPKAVVNVLEGDLNVRSDSCMKSGPCSVFSPPRTCCGICNLIDAEMGFCDDNNVKCKTSGECSFFTPGTCCGTCILIDSAIGYCQS